MNDGILHTNFQKTIEILHKVETISYTMPMHTHNAIEIYLTLSDIPNVMLGDKIYPLSAGSLMVIPPGCVHKMFNYGTDYERYILTIQEEWIRGILKESAEKDYAHYFDPAKPTIIVLNQAEQKELVQNMKELMTCEEDDLFLKYRIFFRIMDWIDSRRETLEGIWERKMSKEVTGAASTVTSIIGYIDSHIGENLTVEKIAEELYLNHDYVARVFKKYVNTTIKQYVRIERMTKAKNLLENGYSVSDTQIQTGYNSYEHFFRTFKKMYGITPKEYQKQFFQQNAEKKEGGN